MHIGIDVSQAIYGTGVSDYTIDLVRALPHADPTNKYTLFGSSLRRSKKLKQLFPQAIVFNLPPTLLDLLWNRLHVVNVENFTGDVDVFHTSDWSEPPASSPKVTTVHDLSPFIFPDEMASGTFRNITSTHKARINWVVKESNKIICVSQSTASDLVRLFPATKNRVIVIPEALPTRFAVRPPASTISRFKKAYGLSEYLVTIGTPQPRKNIPTLVKSYSLFKDKLRLPEKLVVIGGHGWGITDIPDLSQVIFTGYLPNSDARALLAGASCFVFPSLYEGFGLPILNAFYQQVPVVTSNTSSLPEVAGTAAVLVDPSSPEAIAHGIQAAIKNRKSLISSGLKQLSKFSWENTAKKTLLVYSQVC